MSFRHPQDGPRTKPLPVSSLREEPTVTDLAAERDRRRSMETPDADLIAERDRVDRAWEEWTGEPAPLTTEEAKRLIAHELATACEKLTVALGAANRDDLADLYPRVALVALEADKLLSDLVDGGDAA